MDVKVGLILIDPNFVITPPPTPPVEIITEDEKYVLTEDNKYVVKEY